MNPSQTHNNMYSYGQVRVISVESMPGKEVPFLRAFGIAGIDMIFDGGMCTFESTVLNPFQNMNFRYCRT